MTDMKANRARLRSSEEMMEALKAVNDERDLVLRFYPELTRMGGKTYLARGIVNVLMLSIAEYEHNFDDLTHARAMSTMLEMDGTAFIRAMTDDEEVAEEACRIWQGIFGANS